MSLTPIGRKNNPFKRGVPPPRPDEIDIEVMFEFQFEKLATLLWAYLLFLYNNYLAPTLAKIIAW